MTWNKFSTVFDKLIFCFLLITLNIYCFFWAGHLISSIYHFTVQCQPSQCGGEGVTNCSGTISSHICACEPGFINPPDDGGITDLTLCKGNITENIF